MIDFEVGKDFLVAVSCKYREGEAIDLTSTHGVKGRIVEPISHQEYLEVWCFRGFPKQGVGIIKPKYYYRCRKDGI
jgi:hypothetical protein